MHVHVHTDYMPMNIHILEGEGKSFVSWDYIPGRCQETQANGFHITILSLIEIFAIASVSVGFQIPKLLQHIRDVYLSTSSAET